MALAVQSVATGAWNTSTSITITKPTGLAEGDTLLAIIFAADESVSTVVPALPAGWTSFTSAVNQLGNYPGIGIFYKTAVAADVAASNFTFSATNADYMSGVLYRVSGTPGYFVEDLDIATNVTSGAPKSFTKDLDVPIADCLVFSIFYGSGNGNNVTNASYTLTGATAVTFTERFDGSSVSDFYFAAVADGEHDAIGNISAAGATPTSSNAIPHYLHRLLIVTPAQDASGTTALLAPTPTFSAPVSGGGTSGTAELLASSPTLPAPASEVATAKWTNTDKNTAQNITNPDKS